MHRRDFIKLTALLGASGALPVWSRAALAVDNRPALPMPALLKPDAQGRIDLRLQSGVMNWLPGKTTPTYGVNGSVLGPALWLERGQAVNLHVLNVLAEAATLHWHGMEVPGVADGGPQAVIEPGKTWQTGFIVDQPAATCWFHPHTHGQTGRQVAMGLGGLILVNDEESQKLPLPNRWGVDDVPVILQDRRFTPEGKIDYQLDVMTAAVGWFGDQMLANGALYPQHHAPRGWLRLRFLNGCNARSLRLAASDGRPLYVIASDGGFLAEPVKMTELPILMGERFEALVDTRDGKPFDIVTLPVRQLGMTVAPFDRPLPILRIQPTLQQGEIRMPDTLARLPPLSSAEGTPSRWLQLMMDPQLDRLGMQQMMQRYGIASMAGMEMKGHGDMNMAKSDAAGFDFHHANQINGAAFDMTKPLFDVKLGQYEKWTLSGEGDMMLHPFHIHGAQFRILSENGKPPAPHRRGWKDTVWVEGWRSEVLVRFNHPAPAERAYMAHCHLLEHEDTGMMMSFTVSA